MGHGFNPGKNKILHCFVFPVIYMAYMSHAENLSLENNHFYIAKLIYREKANGLSIDDFNIKICQEIMK